MSLYCHKVLIVSIFPSQARILQVYFDGEYLHIAKSKLYEFKSKMKEKYTLFARWSVAEPCGEVKTVQIDGEDLPASVIKQMEAYASSSAEH